MADRIPQTTLRFVLEVTTNVALPDPATDEV